MISRRALSRKSATFSSADVLLIADVLLCRRGQVLAPAAQTQGLLIGGVFCNNARLICCVALPPRPSSGAVGSDAEEPARRRCLRLYNNKEQPGMTRNNKEQQGTTRARAGVRASGGRTSTHTQCTMPSR